jgi:hypothetical protein
LSFRLRLTAVSGFPRLWLNIRRPCNHDRLPPLQTGRADFPHPACPRTLRVRQTSCDWAAPRNPRLGEALHAEAHTCGSKLHESRHTAYASPSPAGALRSTGVTRLPRYYDPLRLLPRPDGGYEFPPTVADRTRVTPPPGQVSQVPDRSVDARCPQPPRRARPLPRLVASRSGFRLHPFGKVGHSRLRFNEAESGSRFRITGQVPHDPDHSCDIF